MKSFRQFQESYLTGSRQPLYHWTDLTGLIGILKHEALGYGDEKSYDPINGYKKLRPGWVSFTRNKNYAIKGKSERGGVRFTFDGDVLRQKYKIEPTRGIVVRGIDGPPLEGREARFEAEEAVLGPVKLKDGLTKIEITKPVHDEISRIIQRQHERIDELKARIERIEAGAPVTVDEYRKHIGPNFHQPTADFIEKRVKEDPTWRPRWFQSKACEAGIKQTVEIAQKYQGILDQVTVI